MRRLGKGPTLPRALSWTWTSPQASLKGNIAYGYLNTSLNHCVSTTKLRFLLAARRVLGAMLAERRVEGFPGGFGGVPRRGGRG